MTVMPTPATPAPGADPAVGPGAASAAPQVAPPVRDAAVLPLPIGRRPPGRHVVRRLAPPGHAAPAPSVTAVQGSLALDLDVPAPAPPLPRPDVALLARRSGLIPLAGAEVDPLHTWATQFAQALLEVAIGTRPVVQLLRATDEEVYADLQRRATLLSAHGTRARSVRHATPSVRSVHVTRTHVYAAEISVVAQHGRRCRAIAIRAERREGRWQATDVQFG